jgi:hypothetical protein
MSKFLLIYGLILIALCITFGVGAIIYPFTISQSCTIALVSVLGNYTGYLLIKEFNQQRRSK